MSKTNIGDILKYGVLIFGGILFLKAIGGVKGLTDIFGGIGNLFGAAGDLTAAATGQDLLTQNIEAAAARSAAFQALPAAEQQYVIRETVIEEAKFPHETIPDILETGALLPFPYNIGVPFLGAVSGAAEQMFKDTSQQQYLKDIQTDLSGSLTLPISIPEQEQAIQETTSLVERSGGYYIGRL